MSFIYKDTNSIHDVFGPVTLLPHDGITLAKDNINLGGGTQTTVVGFDENFHQDICKGLGCKTTILAILSKQN